MAAYPTYFLIGQELWLGDLQEEFLTEAHDDRYDDAEASIDMYNYQLAAVDTYDTTPTSAVSNTQQAADTDEIGHDVSMMRYLLDNDHPSGMAFIKRTDQGVVGNNGSSRWGKTYSESYSNLATPHTALNTLITGRGDTMDVKGFFLCVGYAEGVLADATINAAFEADLEQLISDLRTDYASSTTPVVIDLPPASFSGSSAAQNTALANARAVIKKVASEDANVSYVHSDDLQRSNGSTKWYHGGLAVIEQGLRLAKEMSRMVTGRQSVGGAGAPTYIMLGDDNCTGNVDTAYVENAAGVEDGGIPNARTWNWANNQWEALDGTTNSNTSTDGQDKFGPDIPMMQKLTEQHPGDTVYVFKLGRNTSSVSDENATGGAWPQWAGDIYTEVSTEWGTAKSELANTEEVVPDVRGLILIFGQHDITGSAASAAFLAGIRTTIEDYRALFKTNAVDTLPVKLVRPQDTGNYSYEYVQTVREACAEVARTDANVEVINLDAYATNDDNKTLSGSGITGAGVAIAEAFA